VTLAVALYPSCGDRDYGENAEANDIRSGCSARSSYAKGRIKARRALRKSELIFFGNGDLPTVKHPLTYREAMSMGRIKTRRVISEEAEKWGKVIRVSCKQSLPLLGSTKCTKTLKLDSAS
jgi:hypothetical protein